MRRKVALVTGCTGQDGSYLCELLNDKGYEVHGIVRRSSVPQQRIPLLKNVKIHDGDMTDAFSIHRIIKDVSPSEIYNLAAQTHVGVSFKMPEYTRNVNEGGLLNVLEAVRQDFPDCRIYQASTSEMFGKVLETPQNENTEFNPISPYGVSKVAAHKTASYYRDYYGLYVACGILFNHESPRRGEEFLTQKVIKAAVAISKGKQDKLELGNLSPKRDWGYAPEYVEAMWLMLQDDKPEDYVIATGISNTVRDFVRISFKLVGLGDYHQYVTSDVESEKRPAEVLTLRGDASKARRMLGWWPETNLENLIKIMIEAEREGEQFSYESMKEYAKK